MKEIKKAGLLTLVSAITFGTLLTGCGSGEKEASADNEEKITLNFWNHWSADHEDGGEGQFIAEKVVEFNELHPEIEVVMTNVPIDDYTGTKLTTAFATGEGPDVFSVSPGTINNFIDAGIAYPMNDHFTDEMRADFSEEALESVTVDGNIVAVPFEQELLALFYDIDVFEEAGLEPPTTWDEMMEAAEILTTPERAGMTFDMTKGAYGIFNFMPFVWQGGGDFFEDGKSLLNTQSVIDALALWKTMVDNGSANIKPTRSGSDIGMIADGETAMQICGTFAIRSLERDYSDRNIGVVPIPIPEGGKPVTVAGGWRLMVNSGSPYAEAAAAFAAWFFLDEDTEHSTGWNTKAKFAYSPRASVIENAQEIYQEGLRAVFTNEIFGTERPELAMDPQAADIVGDMIQDALFAMSAEEAAENAHQKLQGFFDSNQ